METLKIVSDWASLAANSLTIAASTLAIYVFFAKGKDINTALNLLVSWSFQLTLTELREKLERLNEYNAKEPSEIEEIRNILHEIAGQLKGNKKICQFAPDLIDKVERAANNKKLTEPMKRSLVSEIRENLRNIEISATSNDSE